MNNKKELTSYCCPKCGSEFIEEFDSLDSEIDLDDNTVYLRQAVSCQDCGEEFTMIVTGKITDFKYTAYMMLDIL